MPTKIVLESDGRTIDNLEEGQAATYRLITDPSIDQVTDRFYNRTSENRADDTAYDRIHTTAVAGQPRPHPRTRYQVTTTSQAGAFRGWAPGDGRA
jgi:hypothetical protein